MKPLPSAQSLKTALLLALAIGVIAAGCGKASEPEQEIRAWVDNGQRLAEEKNRSALMDMISPAYADERGNSRADLENMFRWYFLRMNRIELVPSVENVTIIGDTAAELTLAVAGLGTSDGTLGFSANAYRFEMELVKDSDDWSLISARWSYVGDTPR